MSTSTNTLASQRPVRRRSRAVAFAAVETLEQRKLLAAYEPTVYDQYMLELANRARMNPAAEAQRYGIDLNEGLVAGTLTSTPRQPLAMNFNLNASARDQASWLRANNQFGHSGPGGNAPWDRMVAAGYQYGGATGSGENAGITMATFLGDLTARVEAHHQGYFVDNTVGGRGHRLNLLAADWKEAGMGYATGPYTYNSASWQAYISVQNFAYTQSGSFLTGVAYADTTRKDEIYTPGEGLAGVTVTAVRSDGATYSTQTWSAGGYTLQLPTGSYTVYGTGGALGGTVTYGGVVIGSENVKRDFRPDYVTSDADPTPPPPTVDPNPTGPSFATLSKGVLAVGGTNGSDTINITVSGSNYVVQRNDETMTFTYSQVRSIQIDAKAGNDTVALGDGVIGSYVFGGDGDDTIYGSSKNDTLTGGAGKDWIDAGGGDDLVNGGGGHDYLMGSSGRDRIFGGEGDDRIYGASGDDLLDGQNGDDRLYGGPDDDELFGGAGRDYLYGTAGNDHLHGQDDNDYLDGGDGADLLDGGDGVDTLSYNERTAGVRVTLEHKYDRVTDDDGAPGERDNALANIEIVAGGSGDDYLRASDRKTTLYGMDGADTLVGGIGRNALYGGAGDDVFDSLYGTSDTLDGGDGNDKAWVDLIDVAITNIETIIRR